MTFIEKLRAETAHQHKALEASRLSKQLLSEDVSIADYKKYLEKLYGFVASFERDILPTFSSEFPKTLVTYKVDLLKKDLEQLGSDLSSLEILSSEQLNHIYPTNEAKLGGLYVLEGSTLGGLVIRQHLVNKLGENIIPATTYFSVYGKETAANWRNFLQVFSARAEETGPEQVIKGAVDTFTFLYTWMDD
jgi:heme oxygenase